MMTSWWTKFYSTKDLARYFLEFSLGLKNTDFCLSSGIFSDARVAMLANDDRD